MKFQFSIVHLFLLIVAVAVALTGFRFLHYNHELAAFVLVEGPLAAWWIVLLIRRKSTPASAGILLWVLPGVCLLMLLPLGSTRSSEGGCSSMAVRFVVRDADTSSPISGAAVRIVAEETPTYRRLKAKLRQEMTEEEATISLDGQCAWPDCASETDHHGTCEYDKKAFWYHREESLMMVTSGVEIPNWYVVVVEADGYRPYRKPLHELVGRTLRWEHRQLLREEPIAIELEPLPSPATAVVSEGP